MAFENFCQFAEVIKIFTRFFRILHRQIKEQILENKNHITWGLQNKEKQYLNCIETIRILCTHIFTQVAAAAVVFDAGIIAVHTSTYNSAR